MDPDLFPAIQTGRVLVIATVLYLLRHLVVLDEPPDAGVGRPLRLDGRLHHLSHRHPVLQHRNLLRARFHRHIMDVPKSVSNRVTPFASTD